MHNISYDMTLTSAGVISLDSFESFPTVDCNTDGSVRVRLASGAPVSTLTEMYPGRSVLIVSRDVYGNCDLAPNVTVPGEMEQDIDFRSAGDNLSLFLDAFLIVECVSRTPV